MSAGAIVSLIIAGFVILVLAALLVRLQLRTRQLRARYGAEYDRIRESQSGRRAAERVLAERERRHAGLDLKPIGAPARERFTKRWALAEAQFVDRPSTAVEEAHRLVVTIMTERGYPTEDYDQRLAVLSVEHAAVLEDYRSAHDIRARHEVSQVSTEELRVAMVHLRRLVEDLLTAERKTARVR